MNATWRSYEELAQHVLGQFADLLGISGVEAKQRLLGKSGTQWELDAKGLEIGGSGFLIVECKQRSSGTLNQGQLAELAFKVNEVGAKGAILITNAKIQSGARKVIESQGFNVVYLPSSGTVEDFLAVCCQRVVRKLPSEQASLGVSFATGSYDTAISSVGMGSPGSKGL